MKAALVLFLLILIPSCNTTDPPPDQFFIIRTEKGSYTVTDILSVKVSFENDLNQPVSIMTEGCGFPAFQLEKFIENDWTIAGGPLCPAIALPPTLLESDGKYNNVVSMYAENYIFSGIYRFRFYITDTEYKELDSMYQYSNVFEIIRK